MDGAAPCAAKEVGQRPLGIQASQLGAVARWANDHHKAVPVKLVASGPRSSLAALVAAALEPEAIVGAELYSSMGSLKEVIEKNHLRGSIAILPPVPFENSHVLIANVASVSFGELWDVMRPAAPERRGAWAHELEQMSPGTRRNAAVKTFFKIWVELDPTAAIEDVEKISDKRVRGMAFAALADAAADSALPADVSARDGGRPRCA